MKLLPDSPFDSAGRAVAVDLGGKKVIVTGASPGSLGFETAKTLAGWGAEVVVTTRSAPEATLAALEVELAHIDGCGALDAYPLDLEDGSSVERFAQWYMDQHGERLDVLVNNAGIHLDLRAVWKEPRLSDDGYEIHFRTNYLGTAHLTHRLLPLIAATGRKTGDARVVNVVSALHTKGRNEGLFEPVEPYHSWVAYGVSKLALVHMTFELERRYAHEGLHAYCLHPGAVFTKIADKGLEGHRVLAAVRKLLAPLEAKLLLSAAEGAQTQIHCASHRDLAGGLYYRSCRPAPASAEANDAAVAARLWEESLRFAGRFAPCASARAGGGS